MSDSPTPAARPEATPTRKRLAFRSHSATPRLNPDAVERQSGITLMAWNKLGPDVAIGFLNSFNVSLQGRPLDLAVASRDGYDAVSDEIRRSAG